jgi:dTDP-4-dehydrorhamnose reductase
VKVLITGADGQLGLDLLDALEEHGHEAVPLERRHLDIADEVAVHGTVESHEPEVVVNAAAWTDVDGCEDDPARAHRVNALGPWWLARACARTGARLVTISTDYVFPGVAPVDGAGRSRGWNEFDAVAPINAYGRSKAAGEQLVRGSLAQHHIVRTAWLSGARGSNFVATMLRLGRERGHLAVVDDQVGSPTCTRDLAAAIVELTGSDHYGTWHRANTGSCSWYELAAAVFELARVEVDLVPQPSTALDRPAPRPAWSVLDQTHAEAAGLMALPHWRDGLRRLLDEIGS